MQNRDRNKPRSSHRKKIRKIRIAINRTVSALFILFIVILSCSFMSVEKDLKYDKLNPKYDKLRTVILNANKKTDKPIVHYYNVGLSKDIQDYIFLKAKQNNIPATLIIAVIEVESKCNANIVSSTNDYGLMQINAVNHDYLAKELNITNFLDPIQNIDAGIFILSDLCTKYEDFNKMLMCYNMGEKGARKYWNQDIYKSSYSEKVIETMNLLEKQL